MRIVSFDVGINNLAYAVVDCSEDFELEEVVACDNVDIKFFEHRVVSWRECQLEHGNSATDRVNHFLQEHPEFEQCQTVLIERQPIHGITSVEQLLYSHFRSKAFLVSPNAMHKHFRINHLDYDGRKVRTVEIAGDLLRRFDHFEVMQRKHDIADAVCLLMFWLSCQVKPRVREQVENFSAFISQFAFNYNAPYSCPASPAAGRDGGEEVGRDLPAVGGRDTCESIARNSGGASPVFQDACNGVFE